MAANYTASLTLRLIDRMSAGLRTAGKNIKSFSDSNRYNFERFRSASYPMIAAGGAIVGSLAMITNTAMKFEQGIIRAASIADASGKNFNNLRTILSDMAMRLGPEMGILPIQLTDIFYEISQAGVEAFGKDGRLNKAFEEYTRAAVIMNKVSGVSYKDSVKTINSALMAFERTFAKQGLSPQQRITTVLDSMNVANIKTVASVEDFAQALKFAGPIGDAFNWTMQDIMAALMVFAEKGRRGTVGATALQQSLARLANPAFLKTQRGKIMAAVGFEAYEGGKLKSMTRLLADFSTSLEKLTEKERNLVVAAITTPRAIGPMLSLLSAGAPKLREYAKAQDDAGVSSRMNAMQMQAAKRQLDQMAASFESFQIALGTEVIPLLTDFLKKVNPIVQRAKEWVKANKPLVRDLIKFGAATGGILLLSGAFLSLVGNLGLVIMAAPALAAFFGPAGPILGITAFSIAVVGLVQAFNDMARTGKTTVPVLDKITGALTNWSADLSWDLSKEWKNTFAEVEKILVERPKGWPKKIAEAFSEGVYDARAIIGKSFGDMFKFEPIIAKTSKGDMPLAPTYRTKDLGIEARKLDRQLRIKQIEEGQRKRVTPFIDSKVVVAVQAQQGTSARVVSVEDKGTAEVKVDAGSHRTGATASW